MDAYSRFKKRHRKIRRSNKTAYKYYDMRLIKFRAWHNKLKIMIDVLNLCQKQNYYGDYMQMSIGSDCFGDEVKFYPSEVELMQFTNKYDRLNNEIYEGDICEFKLQSGVIYQVEMIWKDSACAFRLATESLPSFDDIILPSDLTVVGNIYS